MGNIETATKFSRLKWISSIAASKVFYKKAVLKNFAIFAGKILCWGLFLIKLQAFSSAGFTEETPMQLFSCAYCKFFKNIYFEKHLQTAASD